VNDPADAVALPGRYDEHRVTRFAHDLIGHAAPDQAGDGQPGTAGQHDQVSGPCGRLPRDRRGHIRAPGIHRGPDGRTPATGNTDGTTRLWDMASHRQIAALTGPTGPVSSVAFSPDGTTLAVGGGDGTVQLWDRATRRQIATLTDPTGTVTSVAFSRDGKTLAASRSDHTVRLWDVAYLVNVVPRLCASAGRSLTRAEWARYVPVLAYRKVCP
jgi:WD40 repeat protein